MQQWTLDNTQGYSQDELQTLNQELARLLEGIEPHTDGWYDTIKQFAETVASR